MSSTTTPQNYKPNPLRRAATEIAGFEEEASTSTTTRPLKRHRTDGDLEGAAKSNEKHDNDTVLPCNDPPIPGRIDPENDLIWLDLETNTALTNYEDMTILEVAVLVTDRNLIPRDEGIHFVIRWDEEKMKKILAGMISKVKEMHLRSGLWKELQFPNPDQPQYDLTKAENMIIAYLKKHRIEKNGTLAGCGVTYDRNVIKYHMPRLDKILRYQIFDVSSVWQLVKRNYNLRYRSDPNVETAHRAMQDVLYAISEAKLFRDTVFKSVKDVKWPYQ